MVMQEIQHLIHSSDDDDVTDYRYKLPIPRITSGSHHY